jgi:hypothetical protein
VFEVDPSEPAINSAYLLISMNWGGLEGGSYEWESQTHFKELKSVKRGKGNTIIAEVVETYTGKDGSENIGRAKSLTFEFSPNADGSLKEKMREW